MDYCTQRMENERVCLISVIPNETEHFLFFFNTFTFLSTNSVRSADDRWEMFSISETSKRKNRETTIIIYFSRVSWSHESLRFRLLHASSIYLKNFFLQMNLKENPQNSKWFYLNLSSNSVVFDAKHFHFSFLNTSFVNANSIQTAQKTLLMSFLCQNLRNRSVFPSYFCHIQSVDLPFFCTLSFVECSKAENRNFSISQNKHERTSKMSTDKNPIISIELA